MNGTPGRPGREEIKTLQRRTGMTLVEMLVATAMTLIMMGVIAQVFANFGRGVSTSRTALDLNARLRAAVWRLRQDLAGATAQTVPPLNPQSNSGYFEIIEGPRRDGTTYPGDPLIAAADAGSSVLAADVDDVLLFTTRNSNESFRGKFEGVGIESGVAEVAWFARKTIPETTPTTFTIYRKQMLVLGYIGAGQFDASNINARDWGSFPNGFADVYETYDVSVSRRKTADGALDRIVPNTLGDLTKRECRFLHNIGGIAGDNSGKSPNFPYKFVSNQNHQVDSTTPLVADTLPANLRGLIFDSTSSRNGEDVMLTNVVAFDVRVFDPAAPIGPSASGNDCLSPLDGTALGAVNANGAYVDLGNAVATKGPSNVLPRFEGFGDIRSKLMGSVADGCVYDTWSTHYEANGIDEDNDNTPDQGTDGLDTPVPPNAADGVIDDVDEREVQPPYPYPLRGIEVRIRCYDPLTRQGRQATVRHTFVPH